MSRRIARCLTSALALVLVPVTALAVPAQAKTSAVKKLTEQFNAVGSSHIGSIDADLPIMKTTLSATLRARDLSVVGGTLPIAPQMVSFTALGAVPLRATTTLVQASPITGTLRVTQKGNILTTSVSYTIKLTDVEAKVLGQWVPLDVGNNCRTVTPAVIAVSSPPGKYFDIGKGGSLTGTYTIGKFQNCSPLQLPDPFGIGSVPVNSLVPGSDNTVSLSLSHGRLTHTG